MAIGSVKSSGFSLPTTRPVSTEATPAVGGQAQGFKELQGALKELSNNPILRSLLGESGFDGVKGKGHANKHHGGHKADGAEKTGGKDSKATSEDGIKKLVDGLKKFVQLLEQMTGKKNETQDGAGKTGSNGTGAPAAEGAEGAQASGGAEAAEGAQAAGGAEAAEGAQQTEGAQEAEEANKDPLSQLMDTLKKIISQLETLMASLSKQQPGNTGIVPEGATRGTNTGIVPPGAVTGTNTGIVPPGATEV